MAIINSGINNENRSGGINGEAASKAAWRKSAKNEAA